MLTSAPILRIREPSSAISPITVSRTSSGFDRQAVGALLKSLQTPDLKQFGFSASEAQSIRQDPVAFSRSFLVIAEIGGIRQIWKVSKETRDSLIGLFVIQINEEKKAEFDLSLLLHPAYRGRGLAQDIISRGLEIGFQDNKMKRCTYSTLASNEKSLRLAARCGFQPLNTQQNNDLRSFVLTKMQWMRLLKHKHT